MCKFAAHVLCSHLRGHLDDKGILTQPNHRFCKGHSCESQLLLTTHEFFKHRDTKHQVDIGILERHLAQSPTNYSWPSCGSTVMSSTGLHNSLPPACFLSWGGVRVFLGDDRSAAGHSTRTSTFLLYVNYLPSAVGHSTRAAVFAVCK